MNITRRLLENRIKRLEQRVYERTVGRGGGDSTPYKVWKYLRDEGPKTRPEIGAHFNSGALKVLPDMERENCVTKQGNLYSYNPDYNWEDVGVLPRTMAQELQQAVQNGEIETDDAEGNTAPVNQPRTRAPRQRVARPNLFSKNIPDIKAALDAGENINTLNGQGRTPLLVALANGNSDAAQFLLDNGANTNAVTRNGTTALGFALTKTDLDRPAIIKKLIDKGADVSRPCDNARGSGNIPFFLAIRLGLPESIYPSLLNDKLISNSPYVSPNDIVVAVLRKKLSDSVTNEIFDKVIDAELNSNKPNLAKGWRLGSAACTSQYDNGNLRFLDRLMKHGVFPSMLYHYWTGNTAKQIYSRMKEAIDKNYNIIDKVTFINTANQIRERENIDDDFDFSSILTPDAISKMDDEEKSNLAHSCITNNDTRTLRKFASSPIDNMDSISQIINKLAKELNGNTNTERNITRAALMAIDDSYINDIDRWIIRNVALSKNRYLIDRLIDLGLGNRIAAAIDPYRVDSQDYATVKKALNNANIDYTSILSDRDKRATILNNQSHSRVPIDRLKSAIDPENDVWTIVRDLLRDYPNMLDDPRVVELVNDKKYDSSYCARQLRNRIAEREREKEANKPKYDF